MTTIATLTMNPAIDTSCRVAHVTPNHKLRCQSVQRDPGGGGINVSRAVAELGGGSIAVYTSGGTTGELLDQMLEEVSGLTRRRVRVDGPTRENLVVAEERSEQQYRFGMPGAELSEAECQSCLSELRDCDSALMVASGSLPPGADVGFYAEVARLARQKEARFVLDTRGEPLRRAMREGVYLLKPNLRELGEMFESEGNLEDEERHEELVRRVLQEGWAEVVVLSLGASGVLMATGDDMRRVRSPTVPIQSRVGAGDSMVAGIVRGLAEGRSVEQAVRLGVAAGAAAVMTPGTQLCRREDVERLEATLAAEA